MRSPRTRFTLVGFSLVLIAGTALFLWNLQERDRRLTAAQRDVLSRLEAMSAAVDDIAAAQQASVLEPGRLDEQWLSRVSVLVQEISDEAATLAPLTHSAGAAEALGTVVDATAALTHVDARVRQRLARTPSQAALDLLAEGRDILGSMQVELRNLRFAETAAFETSRAALLGRLWLLLGAVALAWIGGLFLLTRVPHSRQKEPLVLTSADPLPADEAPETAPRSGHALDLHRAAVVCTAMSRVRSAEDLHHVLRLGAEVLGAKGVAVWMATGEGLIVAASHGYDETLLSRMGPILRDGDNVTAEAWRTGEVRTFSGDPTSASGIAVPILLEPSRPFGVFTIEIRTGLEHDTSIKAVASMFAAQLTSILGDQSGAESDGPEAFPVSLEVSGGA